MQQDSEACRPESRPCQSVEKVDHGRGNDHGRGELEHDVADERGLDCGTVGELLAIERIVEAPEAR